MKKTTKIIASLFVLVSFIPSIAFASWWNPFTWFSSPSSSNNSDTSTTALEQKIVELENKVNSMASTTASTTPMPKVVATGTPATTTPIIVKKIKKVAPSVVNNPTSAQPPLSSFMGTNNDSTPASGAEVAIAFLNIEVVYINGEIKILNTLSTNAESEIAWLDSTNASAQNVSIDFYNFQNSLLGKDESNMKNLKGETDNYVISLQNRLTTLNNQISQLQSSSIPENEIQASQTYNDLVNNDTDQIGASVKSITSSFNNLLDTIESDKQIVKSVAQMGLDSAEAQQEELQAQQEEIQSYTSPQINTPWTTDCSGNTADGEISIECDSF